MNEMNQVQVDEIDLFELLQTLWDGKWLISAFVAIAVLLGGFLFLQNQKYQSKVIYSIDTIPPFYEANKALTDFQRKFYSVSVFNEWKQNNSNTSIVFEDFSTNESVDGFLVSKSQSKQLATFGSEKHDGSFVLIESNQLAISDDFFKYATHINGLLKAEYIERAKDELNIIETRFKDFSTANDAIISQILTIDRYVVSAEKGSSVLSIRRPTMPKKVSPKSFFILAISIVLGGMVGVFFILVRNVIKKRKEHLAKA